MLDAYRDHVAERAALNIPPKPLNAEQVAGLVDLLKNPPAGEEAFLLDLITHRVPPGVDEAAYVKAGFLSALVRGEASSPVITPEAAVVLLGNMHGGYNIETLVSLLKDDRLSALAAADLSTPCWYLTHSMMWKNWQKPVTPTRRAYWKPGPPGNGLLTAPQCQNRSKSPSSR